ncbi:hypothetical protein NPIL_163561 [Nephila pilipes]|uniref:Secreted protein n=1 Tax=Nephila pilipes TaxID=299642 RepID=A0A8X6MSA0_NEPPI|nr:hypothetical protein NPIL_163561 [Nephila pilipes]
MRSPTPRRSGVRTLAFFFLKIPFCLSKSQTRTMEIGRRIPPLRKKSQVSESRAPEGATPSRVSHFCITIRYFCITIRSSLRLGRSSQHLRHTEQTPFKTGPFRAHPRPESGRSSTGQTPSPRYVTSILFFKQ